MSDDDLNYLGVEVRKLFEDVPDFGHYIDSHSVVGIVDTVLVRATARVANPTAYVRRALEVDFYGLVLPLQTNPGTILKPVRKTDQHSLGEPREARAAPETPSSKFPQWEDLPNDAEPYINPDHWDSLHFTQLAN